MKVTVTSKVVEKISKDRAYKNILEWLYTNDHSHSNAKEWRENFINMLSWNFKKIKE